MIPEKKLQCCRKLRELGYLIVIQLVISVISIMFMGGYEESLAKHSGLGAIGITLIGYVLIGAYVTGNLRLAKHVIGFAGAGVFFGLYGIVIAISKAKEYSSETGGYFIIACGALLVISDLFFCISAACVAGAVKKRWIWIWVVWFLVMAYVCVDATQVKLYMNAHGINYVLNTFKGPRSEVDPFKIAALLVSYCGHWVLRLAQTVLIFRSARAMKNGVDAPQPQENK